MTSYSWNTWNASTLWGDPPSLPAQLRAAAAAGYACVTLDTPSLAAHADHGLTTGAVAELLREEDLTCLQISNLAITADRTAMARDLAAMLDMVAVLEPRYVQLLHFDPIDATAIELTRTCTRALAEVGVGSTIEFMPMLGPPSIAEAVALIDAVDDPHLTVLLDAVHFFQGPSTWEQLEELPLERLAFVEINDGPLVPEGTDAGDSRVLPGDGEFALGRLRDRLVGRGYEDVVSVEVLSAHWRRQPLASFATTALAAARQVWEGSE